MSAAEWLDELEADGVDLALVTETIIDAERVDDRERDEDGCVTGRVYWTAGECAVCGEQVDVEVIRAEPSVGIYGEATAPALGWPGGHAAACLDCVTEALRLARARVEQRREAWRQEVHRELDDLLGVRDGRVVYVPTVEAESAEVVA